MPLAHMSQSGSERARSKFKEGQRVAGRVLDADPALRRVTLTLKKALCGDKLPPFMSWEVCAWLLGRSQAQYAYAVPEGVRRCSCCFSVSRCAGTQLGNEPTSSADSPFHLPLILHAKCRWLACSHLPRVI